MTLTGRSIAANVETSSLTSELKQRLAQQIHQPTDNISDDQLVAAILLEAPVVADCATVTRQTERVPERVAYVVLSQSSSPKHLHAHLQAVLPEALLPKAYVFLSALPRTAVGQVDEPALASLAVLDSDLVNRWETALQSLPEIEQVAVVIQDLAESSPPLHLSDLLPNWTTEPIADPAESEPALETNSGAGEQREILAIAHGGTLPTEPDAPTVLQEILRRVASQELGEQIVYLQADGSELTQSYGSLLAAAERILAGLRKLGLQPQNKVILQLELPQDILAAFWGCILGGFIPVIMAVAPTYREANSAVDKLCNVWKLLDQPLILTSEALRESVQSLAQWLPAEGFQVSVIETLQAHDPDASHHPSQPEDIAFFNLTSGSTGMPKCISLTHKNLIARARGTNLLNRHDRDDVILNWLPFDHIGSISDWHIRCIELGCRLIYASKEFVLGRPLNWMDLIDRYRITHSWAPNFAYALVNDALKQEPKQAWDLTCVKSLLTAGEAVSSKAVEDFIENLAVYGFKTTAIRPAFGMAEMGSGITYGQPTDAAPLIRHVVDKSSLQGRLRRVSANHSNCTTFTDLGPVIPGVSIRIVDGENSLLLEDTIGYLQVKGDAVFPGYYQNPEVNQEVFLADGWFNTGDLGFISNGHLVVTGRAKETIIINGANYYNHEIEAVVEAVEGVEVSYTAACAVRGVGGATEKLAIFFSPTWSDRPDGILNSSQHAAKERLTELIKTIRQTVVSKIGLNPDFLLPLPKTAIPKTAIGKIQRSQLSKQFEAGNFDPILKQVDILLVNANTLPDWFFRKIWRPKAIAPAALRASGGTILVFADSSGLGERVCDQLNRDRHDTLPAHSRCIQVEVGSRFEKLENDSTSVDLIRYQIDPKNPVHYQQLLESLAEATLPITQVLHLWSYTAETAISSPAELEATLDRGVYSVLFLLQALAAFQAGEHTIRLLVVANHVQPISPKDSVAAAKAPVLGLLKVAAQEMSWLDCRHLDLDSSQTEENAALILQELQNVQVERELAYRHGQRLVPRLEKVDWSQLPRQPIPFKPGGLYLLSGGLGGIGVEIARYLLQTYNARLLLIGRTPLPEKSTWSRYLNDHQDEIARRIAAFQSLENLGGAVSYAAVDLGELEALQNLVEQAKSQWQCDLDGIIHLAGSASERLCVEETRDRFAETLRPKVLGTWTLHQLLQDKPGSLFLSFSSVNGFFGGTGTSAYAAANCFLEAFAHAQRDQNSLQSYCYAWSMWDEVGMSRGYLMKEFSRAQGYYPISVQKGLHSLLGGLHHGQGHLLIGLDESKRRIQQSVESSIAPLQTLAAYFTTNSEPGVAERLNTLLVRDRFNTPSVCHFQPLQALPLTSGGEIDREQLAIMGQRSTSEQIKPRTELEQEIAGIWQEILGVSQVGVQDNFFELGGSSLQAARVFAEIDRIFGKNLPLATLFEAPTVEQLARLLSEGGEAGLWSTVVAVQPNGSQPPLFCIHGAGGNVLMYRRLVEYLGSDQPLYGIQPQGLDGNETPIDRLQEMAATYVQAMREFQPQGPYFLAGLSVGGAIAFEMAQILRAQGQQVGILVLIDALGPGYPKLLPVFPRLMSLLPFVAVQFPKRALVRASRLLQRGGKRGATTQGTTDLGSQKDQYLAKGQMVAQLERSVTASKPESTTRKNRSLTSRLGSLSLQIYKYSPWAFIVPRFFLDSGNALPSSHLQQIQAANVKAMLAYRPEVYPGQLVLFRASHQPPGCYSDPTLGWGQVVTGEIETFDVPGFHGERLLYTPKSLQVLGTQLKACLVKAQQAVQAMNQS
jgi:acyl-CoA synthetase (AMP-forming)/AMP-acid ligase II/pimeloyl-ACP methyl ester carboxylesterase/NADP-dependent 3-hydroxy acid dehydrogenase YdfG